MSDAWQRLVDDLHAERQALEGLLAGKDMSVGRGSDNNLTVSEMYKVWTLTGTRMSEAAQAPGLTPHTQGAVSRTGRMSTMFGPRAFSAQSALLLQNPDKSASTLASMKAVFPCA